MKIAAFADCHIGSYGKKIDAKTGLNARLLDTLESLEFVSVDSRNRGATTLLFAGDMFRNSRPTPTELVGVMNALDNCHREELVLIDGNHDQPRGSNEASAISPLANLRGMSYLTRPCFIGVGNHSVQVAVLPYPNRAQLAANLPEYASLPPEDADKLVSAHVEAILRGLAAQLDPGKPSILLAHLSIDVAEAGAERGIMAGRDICIPLHAIPEEFTFAVFGHIHKAQDFAAYGRPNVFYTGSTDRIDFGEEGEEKSYVLMDTEAGTWERVPIPCRRYQTLDVIREEDEFRLDFDLDKCQDAICRVKIRRPENYKPDYAQIQGWVESAGCWDFRGFTEDVQRVATVRSEEITKAESLGELLAVWHEAKGCPVDVGELVAKGEELERSVA